MPDWISELIFCLSKRIQPKDKAAQNSTQTKDVVLWLRPMMLTLSNDINPAY